MEKLIDLDSPGIYKITTTFNNKIYIGSAVNINNRFKEHERKLEYGTHHNIHLQRHFKKYGTESLIFELVEVVHNNSQLLIREQYWIDHYKNSKRQLFNINPTAGSNLGKKFSQDVRDKISRARTGKSHHSEVEKLKRSKRMMGNKYGELVKKTDEYREKQSKKSRGENNGKSILTEKDVIKIKTMLANGIRQVDIARLFNVARDRIWHIKEGRQWKHITI